MCCFASGITSSCFWSRSCKYHTLTGNLNLNGWTLISVCLLILSDITASVSQANLGRNTSSRLLMFFKMGVLKNFAIFTGKAPVLESLFKRCRPLWNILEHLFRRTPPENCYWTNEVSYAPNTAHICVKKQRHIWIIWIPYTSVKSNKLPFP